MTALVLTAHDRFRRFEHIITVYDVNFLRKKKCIIVYTLHRTPVGVIIELRFDGLCSAQLQYHCVVKLNLRNNGIQV